MTNSRRLSPRKLRPSHGEIVNRKTGPRPEKRVTKIGGLAKHGSSALTAARARPIRLLRSEPASNVRLSSTSANVMPRPVSPSPSTRPPDYRKRWSRSENASSPDRRRYLKGEAKPPGLRNRRLSFVSKAAFPFSRAVQSLPRSISRGPAPLRGNHTHGKAPRRPWWPSWWR